MNPVMANNTSPLGPAPPLLHLGTLLIAWAVGTLATLPLLVEKHGGDVALAGGILGIGGLATVVFILTTSGLLSRFTTIRLASAGGVVYGLGLAMLVLAQGDRAIYYCAGAVLGLGTGLNFTMIPMIYSAWSSDANRARQFSVLGAINGIGIGLAPVAASRTMVLGATLNQVYACAALLCFAGAALFASMSTAPGEQSRRERPTQSHWRSDLRTFAVLLRADTRYPIAMVFLGSSMLGSLMNFQASIGASLGVDYALFFAAYSITVIVGRLWFGRLVSTLNPYRTIVTLLALVVAGLIGLACVRQNHLLYASCAIVLGLGYGLSYPLIQAQAVNLSPLGLRTQSLVLFTLFFFVGGQGFAVFSGHLLAHSGYRAFLFTMVTLAGLQLLVAIRHLCVASASARARASSE